MKVLLVPSAVHPTKHSDTQFASSYLINDTIAVDAGTLGFYRTPQEQARVKHILITHTHIDHMASLPVFLDNVFSSQAECVTVHGISTVIECLKSDIFNDRVWPDFIRLSTPQLPILKLNILQERQPIQLEGLRITPIPVNHVVPTTGYLVEEKNSAILIVSDTGPTSEIWDTARHVKQLKAVFLEATFPNRLGELAALAKHLTPAMFCSEASKLHRQVKFIAIHIKPRFHDEIVRELQSLHLPDLEIGRFGIEYQWD